MSAVFIPFKAEGYLLKGFKENPDQLPCEKTVLMQEGPSPKALKYCTPNTIIQHFKYSSKGT